MKPTTKEDQALKAYRQGDMDPEVNRIAREYHQRCEVKMVATKIQQDAIFVLATKASQDATRLNQKATKALLMGFNVAAEKYLEESQASQEKALRFGTLHRRLAYSNQR